MSHNITVKGGTSVRLPTAGKYCDRDIIVTAEGGGLALDVVTASALPDTVVDGQIVVITETVVGTVYIDTDEPASPASGDVWIVLAAGGDAALELTEESPYLRNGLTGAKQWNGSSWDSLDGYIGIDSTWVQFAMALPPVGTAFASMTWKQVSAVCKAGFAQQYWSIGDQKNMIDGDASTAMRIIGFDHDRAADASTYGREMAGITLQMAYAQSTLKQPMNSAATSGIQWYSDTDSLHCTARKTTLPNFIAANAPAELQKVIVPVTKEYMDRTAGAFKTVSDAVFLLSPNEIIGGYEANGHMGEGSQYEYYSAGNSKIMKTSSGTAVEWWTRSTHDSATYFAYITTTGTRSMAAANGSRYLVPCFCV